MLNLKVASSITVGDSRRPVDFIGKGNLWIDDDYTHRTTVFARELIMKALQKTAPGQLEVVVFDKNLMAISSPFASLQNSVLKVLSLEGDLMQELQFLKLHIQGVNNVLQGRSSSLVDFRESIGQAVESYKLVVLALDLYGLDSKIKEDLSILLKAGPRAGVSFLIVSTTVSADQFLVEKCTIVASPPQGQSIYAESIIDFCNELIRTIDKTAIEPIPFTDIQNTNQMWTESSTDGLTFAIGKYGINTVEITMGSRKDQRHNALITGAVGQGKSNAITVIIHSLCQRYSPQELELYLLDFKEGITLQSYSNVGQEVWLAHAKALGLESDIDFGIAVLEHLFGIYEQRMALFKTRGVQGIKEYRERTGEIIPRILLIIDEFQMMFEERETAKISATLLSKCFRLFRAAGIHIILASQTIANGIELNKDSDIFAQTPIRIALKNSVRESEATLGLGNVAASDLHMGQAIVNLDYGALSSNRKVSIALADEQVLKKLRQTWWKAIRLQSEPPYIFDGKKAAKVTEALDWLLEQRKKALGSTGILIGETISVSGQPLHIRLERETGRNVALIGAGSKESINTTGQEPNNIAIGILQSAGISLALENSKGDAQFIMCSLLDEAVSLANNMLLFARQIRQLGFLIEELPKSEFVSRLDEIADSLNNRTEHDDDIFILGFALDKLVEMPSSFEHICKDGPANGVHIIGWWQKMDRFEDHIGFGNNSYFDVKVMLRVDARDVQRGLGLYDTWVNKDNRALVADAAYLERPVNIIPFSPLTPTEINIINTKMIQ